MSYLRRLDKIVAGDEQDDNFNPVAILKYDSRFKNTVNNMIQTVKHFDAQYPNVGLAEILAALMNDVMEELFPNVMEKNDIVDDIADMNS